MTASFDRRRNARPDNCCVCTKPVPANEGWLYADTRSQRSRSRHRTYGTWSKKVKCDRCHREKLTHKWQADNLDNPQPAEPVVRPWSVASVKKWTLELGTVETGEGDFKHNDVALYLVGSFGRQLISSRDRIDNRFTAPTGYSLEQFLEVDGKHLSQAAVKHLSPLILAIIVEVNRREKEGGIEAAARLNAAGVDAVKHPHADYWTIKMGGLVTLGDGPHQAIAIDLSLSGDYLKGYSLGGYDRRSGVSKWTYFTVEEVIALKGAIDAGK